MYMTTAYMCCFVPTQLHRNMRITSHRVQPCLYHDIHMVPGHALPVNLCVLLALLGRTALGVTLLLLVLSGDIETNPGPVSESSGLV